MDTSDQTSSSTSGSAASSTASSTPSTRDQLVSDLKLVMKDAEDLLKGGGQQTYDSARARFQSTLQTAKGHYGTLENKVVTSSKDVYENADRYVQDKPWQAIGIGAAAGVLLGLLIGRGK